MKRSKDFYKMQFFVCGTTALFAVLFFIKGAIEWYTGTPNGFENATTICWFGTTIMSCGMLRNYRSDYQEQFGEVNNENSETDTNVN
jgi:hypothetical protein